MTSKLDPQELERLSKAATQGELRLYGELDVGLDYEPFFGAPLEGNMHPLQPMTREDQAFVMALWNAYRTGQLVPAMPSGNEVAWLIERDDLRTAESGDRVCLHYYAESRPGRHYWTPDHLKAKRFPTCESAMVECNNDPLLRVCEHMWMGSQPSEKHAEMVNHLRQLARKQEGYGMSFSDPSPRGGGTASINLYGDRAKAAIWLFKNADRIADALTARAALGEKP